MIVKAAVLIPGDDEHAVGPARRLADDFVHLLDELLAGASAAERVLGISVLEVISERVIARLDESVSDGVERRIVDVALEIGEVLDVVVDADAVQKADIGKNVAGIDPERDIRLAQTVVIVPLANLISLLPISSLVC
jgi:hypothetical protein